MLTNTSKAMLFDKQFVFQLNSSTEHAILQLVSDISGSFEKGKYTLEIFINLSKAFDTSNHKMLISKLEHHDMKGLTLRCSKSYPSERKQCISYSDVAQTNMYTVAVSYHTTA